MKKLLLLFILFIPVLANSQNKSDDVYFSLERGTINTSPEPTKKIRIGSTTYMFNNANEGINLAGIFLKKSAKSQYIAYGTSTVGAGLAIGSTFAEKSGTRNGLLITSGGCLIIGIIFQIKSTDYKFKSGKVLQLTSGKVSLNF